MKVAKFNHSVLIAMLGMNPGTGDIPVDRQKRPLLAAPRFKREGQSAREGNKECSFCRFILQPELSLLSMGPLATFL